MRQKKKKEIDKAAIALVLCFSVVAIASVFTVKSNIDKLNLANENVNIGEINKNEQQVDKKIPTVDSKDTQTAKTPSEGLFEAPLSGEIIKGFSIDTPIYSKTLDQYMVHGGVDIAAPKDTQVKAIADGTVTNVYTDDKYGVTVEINHGNGISAIYASLSTGDLVEISDVVKKGQVISGVGEGSLFESMDESHLHFEVWKDGKPIDPTEYLPK